MARITTAGIFREDNLFLVAKRRPGGSMGGCWEFPGGKTIEGESAKEALAREIREELGAEIAVGDLLVSEAFSNNGTEFSVLAFEAVFRTPPAALTEHDQIRWLPFRDIAALELADSDRKIYEKLKIAFNMDC